MGMRLMVPLALCCAAVSSSSLAMQFMGDGLMKPFRDIFNLATNGQNSGERSEASASEYCELKYPIGKKADLTAFTNPPIPITTSPK